MKPVLEIRQARREGARVLIILAGVSGSGKTYTALELALGMANRDPSKIGFLDTENRRGSLYADIFSDPARKDRTDEPFLIGDLFAPFSPQRYIDAIHAFQEAGVKVLVIDSGSHEWEGIGGCVDIAEAGNPKLPNWNKAKAEHKRFMNAMLTCDMDIILCLRAREKSKPEKRMVDGREKTVYIDMGLQAITEKNVLFEATASLMLHEEGTRQDVVKCPGPIREFLARGEGYITAEDGAGIRRWIDGGCKLDPAVERYRNRLLSVTENGAAYIRESWSKVPQEIRTSLGEEFLASLVASAEAHEAHQASAREEQSAADVLNAAMATPEPAPKTAAAAALGPDVFDDPSAAD